MLLTAVTALALGIPTLRAQDTPAGTPQLEEQLNKLHAETERAQEQAQLAQVQADVAYADNLGKIDSIRSAHRVPKGLVVVRSSEVDPKEQENLEMDMAVMSHLLSKSLEEKLDAQPRPANVLGIDVFYPSAPNQMRSLYLEGYGALFMLNVNFPLLPAPKDEAANEKTSSSSEWETAKQELYGQSHQVKFFSSSTEKYDEAKVNSLKDTLLQALKNGSNIRGLKADDSLTVCVMGAPGGTQSRYRVVKRTSPATPPSSDSRNAFIVSDQSSGLTRQSILTIRAKKSDVDEFAKGKLSLEEFRSRCTTAVYSVSAQGGGAAGFSGGGGFGGMGFGGSWSMTPPVTPVPPEAPEPPGN